MALSPIPRSYRHRGSNEVAAVGGRRRDYLYHPTAQRIEGPDHRGSGTAPACHAARTDAAAALRPLTVGGARGGDVTWNHMIPHVQCYAG